jgi:hypothetical protein
VVVNATWSADSSTPRPAILLVGDTGRILLVNRQARGLFSAARSSSDVEALLPRRRGAAGGIATPWENRGLGMEIGLTLTLRKDGTKFRSR